MPQVPGKYTVIVKVASFSNQLWIFETNIEIMLLYCFDSKGGNLYIKPIFISKFNSE